jgi:hypothetical protein
LFFRDAHFLSKILIIEDVTGDKIIATNRYSSQVTKYFKSFSRHYDIHSKKVFFYSAQTHTRAKTYIIMIISLLMPPLLATSLPYGLHKKRTGHNLQRGPNANWWVLTTANAAGTHGLTHLPKHGGTLENKFLVIHPLTDLRCLISTTARCSALNLELLNK